MGNHCDDCATPVDFPFPVSAYGSTYTSAYVTDNGSLQLLTSDGGASSGCLRPGDQRLRPLADPVPGDLRTDGAGDGIFTPTTGARRTGSS